MSRRIDAKNSEQAIGKREQIKRESAERVGGGVLIWELSSISAVMRRAFGGDLT
jgi:hypothetical protein